MKNTPTNGPKPSVQDSGLRFLLQSRLAAVEARIGDACDRAGRPRDQVTLVAVTKTVSTEVAAVLVELGIHDLGESRPQELWRKREALPAYVRWHLIGHLQRNKIERTAPVHLIHSVDSMRLIASLHKVAGKVKGQMPILLEVNLTGEKSKHGFATIDLHEMVNELHRFPNVKAVGLMTMAAESPNAETSRAVFALLRRLRDEINFSLRPPQPFSHLSMGMSNDFEVAIEEGASLIRLGSVLFQDLPPAAIGCSSTGDD